LAWVNIEVDIFLLWRQWIIPSVNPSIIFNIWPDVWPFFSPPSFLLLPCKSFLCNKTATPPLNLNITQSPTTFPATTILHLSTFVFWLKFYWRFSTLKKQIYHFLKKFEHNFKMLIFIAYFCSICILFGCLLVLLFFFSNKLVVWIYDLYMLWFVLDFVKLYLFVSCWNLCR